VLNVFEKKILMTKIASSCFLFLVIISCSSTKKTGTVRLNPVKDSLTNELHEVYKQKQFNGFSVAIVNENATLYEQGIGYADVEAKKNYTANTIQNIGSISKTLVGIALLKAQELGKLKLDDPINKFLPFKVNNPFFPETPITIRNLATHTSTITDNEFYLKRNYILKPGQDLANLKLFLDDEQVINPYDSLISLKAYLQNVLSTEGAWYKKEDFLDRKPGEIFEYSNVATAVAAYIIELATGEKFNEFTAKYILRPLNMNASGWKFEEVDFSKYARLYQTPDTVLPFYSLITYPDGNFITSANDLAKYLTELIKGFAGHGTILSKESYQEYYRQQLSAPNFLKRNERNPYSDEYNVGIFIGFSFTGNIGHTGGDPGVSTIMFFDPKTKVGRLLIVNTNINDKKGNDEFYNIWNTLEKYQDKLLNSATDKK
jgi:CubicO group peptidase (beta-lactamase class C family)